MPTLELETMRCTLDGPMARLHLNRPEALNAANWAWVQDLIKATAYLAQSTETHVVIISGEGRAFCSGLDVKELAQGYCLGGGLQAAIACDLLVASTDAVFSIPAIKEGIVACLGPMRLARLVGAARAKYLCLLGRRFTASEGLAMGLIHEIVEPAELEQHVQALAQELLAIPYTALRHTKSQIDRAFERDLATLMDEMVVAEEECLRSPEHAAVMAAYRRERSPAP